MAKDKKNEALFISEPGPFRKFHYLHLDIKRLSLLLTDTLTRNPEGRLQCHPHEGYTILSTEYYCINSYSYHLPPWGLIPSRVSGRGYKIGPVCLSVCVCVCASVSSLTAEPFDVRTRNLVQALTLTISWMSSKVKVIGQRSRSPL